MTAPSSFPKAAIFLTLFLAGLIAFGVARFADSEGLPSTLVPTTRQTAFDRVTSTNTLRCAYVVARPQLARDPNTGAFSGIAYDITTELAKRLSLTVEWKEEVNFSTMAEGFKSNRYDAFCFTAYRWIPAARAMDFTTPLFYSTTSVYVRPGETRFDHDLTQINQDSVTVAQVDGEGAQYIREADFPKTSAYSLPQNTDFSMVLDAVKTGKADVAFVNPLIAMPYLLANPGAVRRVESTKPLRIYAHTLAVGHGENGLRTLFNATLDDMLIDGTIDKILDKYEEIPHSFVRVKTP